ncbi:hypothetical protein FJQ98_20190 [Lysinibacillus agricola]|uniref:Uncharacterized protein n=1 Tax=Lysinibacillus agricola TaxID=2590012 RepID=A0ABX7ANK6_9BACI|nr:MULTISPECIES: hypothetical protein [Lysinibacillus]QQP11498.1 hypothetical protein FJQ98_20190 [Lysinibacillus agricola]
MFSVRKRSANVATATIVFCAKAKSSSPANKNNKKSPLQKGFFLIAEDDHDRVATSY